MILVAKQRAGVTARGKLITVVAFHVHDPVSQVPASDQFAKATCHMTELIIVPSGNFQATFIGEPYERLSLVLINRERFFDIDMRARFETDSCQLEMTFRWRRDVNGVWMALFQHRAQVRIMRLDGVAIVELARHERLAIADADNLAAPNPLNLRRMRVRNLAAAYDGNLKHEVPFGRPQSSVANRHGS